MKSKKTKHDDWTCVPQLKKALRVLEDMDHDVYEIRHCQRASTLEDLVSNMTTCLKEALEHLDSINTQVEYITKDEDWD